MILKGHCYVHTSKTYSYEYILFSTSPLSFYTVIMYFKNKEGKINEHPQSLALKVAKKY